MSTSLQLYVIGGLEILIPIIALMVLRRAHKYRISTIICGIGGYFLAVNILMAFASMMLASIGMDQAFWERHALLSEITNIILNVIFQGLTLYAIMRFVLKGNIRIYDAISLGISYWLAEAMILSTNAVSYARVASMSAEGRLSEMVTESLSLEALEEYADSLQTMGISSFYLQLVGIIVLCILTATLCIFIFHSIKRKNIKFFFLSMAGHLVALSLMNIGMLIGGNWVYLVTNVIIGVISIVVWRQYWKWYKAQQADLLRRRKEYQQYVKSANGNVVSVTRVESAEETHSEEETQEAAAAAEEEPQEENS